MRVRREDWDHLHPDDIAWVTEWQLASAFPWIPIGEVPAVRANPHADPSGKSWGITVQVGNSRVIARLPTRDLARVIFWCQEAHDFSSLLRMPASIRGSLAALRKALRKALDTVDPLRHMGYGGSRVSDSGR